MAVFGAASVKTCSLAVTGFRQDVPLKSRKNFKLLIFCHLLQFISLAILLLCDTQIIQSNLAECSNVAPSRGD
ncbi:MAG: hypothetical protein JWO48_2611 [Bryobacterales bacterium]|nr:hypothetical protein [Bryobacterales bacterium]